MSEQCWVGVDVGGTKTAIVISVEPPVVLARQEFPTLQERGPDHALEKIRQGIRDLLAQDRPPSIERWRHWGKLRESVGPYRGDNPSSP